MQAKSQNLSIKKKLLVASIAVLLGYALLSCALRHDYEIEKRLQVNGRDYVVLIHGLYSSAEVLSPIATMLEHNYNVLLVQYPTTEDSIEVISEKYIAPAIAGLDTERNIHFVVHSMGGVVLRHYLDNNNLPQLGKVVFISPPSHGSGLADLFLAKAMKRTFGQAVLQLSTKDDSFVNQLDEPDYPCQVLMGNRSYNPIFSAIIAGKDDGMVPVDSAKLESCGYTLIDKATHRSILKDDRSLTAVANYLAKP